MTDRNKRKKKLVKPLRCIYFLGHWDNSYISLNLAFNYVPLQPLQQCLGYTLYTHTHTPTPAMSIPTATNEAQPRRFHYTHFTHRCLWWYSVTSCFARVVLVIRVSLAIDKPGGHRSGPWTLIRPSMEPHWADWDLSKHGDARQWWDTDQTMRATSSVLVPSPTLSLLQRAYLKPDTLSAVAPPPRSLYLSWP